MAHQKVLPIPQQALLVPLLPCQSQPMALVVDNMATLFAVISQQELVVRSMATVGILLNTAALDVRMDLAMALLLFPEHRHRLQVRLSGPLPFRVLMGVHLQLLPL